MSEVIQWASCPICKSENVAFVEGIGECRECAHKFRQCIPADILPHYYEKQYWNNDKNRQGITSVSYSPEWKIWVNARMKILESFHLIERQSQIWKILTKLNICFLSPPPKTN